MNYPILYDPAESTFTHNGIGVLTSCVSCVVTEERNGEYELEMEYPIDGVHASSIVVTSIIKAKAHDGDTGQLFEVYKIEKPINGIFTVNAQHISYRLSYIPVMPFTATTVATALSNLSTYSAETNPFTFYTDKSTTANLSFIAPMSIRALLGGTSGSILDVYGGEYEFDNFTVKLLASRGSNNGVTLRYGKNITDINQENNIANTYTGVCPYWEDTDGNVVTLTEKILHSANASNFPYQRTIPLDLSSDFQDAPTEAQLRTAANSYMTANNIGVPSVSIDVSFVALWQTEEYADIAPLERVKLCDTVNVYFPKLDISATAKVIKTVYNTLLERYDEIEIGDARSNLATTIVNQSKEIESKTDSSYLTKAITSATDLITGQKGGYVVINTDANGEPSELLIMDTNDISTATNVWRWNVAGLGYSSTGYSGTYGTAITADGKIVADYMTTGTLRAIDIEGVNIEGSVIKFGTTDVVTMSDNTDNDGAKISGDGAIEFETQGMFHAANVSTLSTYDGSAIRMANDSTNSGRNYINLMNYRPDKDDNGFYTDLANAVYITANNTSSTGNTMRIQNYNWNNASYTGNHLIMSSTQDSNYVELQNYMLGSNSLGSFIRLKSTSTENKFEIYNRDLSGYNANWVYAGTSGFQVINYESGSTTTASALICNNSNATLYCGGNGIIFGTNGITLRINGSSYPNCDLISYDGHMFFGYY